jgi:hypothetical protein
MGLRALGGDLACSAVRRRGGVRDGGLLGARGPPARGAPRCLRGRPSSLAGRGAQVGGGVGLRRRGGAVPSQRGGALGAARDRPGAHRRDRPATRHGISGIRLHRSRSLDAQDTTSHEGIPITTVSRTLLDLAATTRADQLERALAQADQAGGWAPFGVTMTLNRAHPRARQPRRDSGHPKRSNSPQLSVHPSVPGRAAPQARLGRA